MTDIRKNQSSPTIASFDVRRPTERFLTGLGRDSDGSSMDEGGEDDEEAEPHEQRTAELLKLRVKELKELLRDKGLRVSGRKAELVDRLLACN